jgi:hypothetical protein
VQYDELFSNAEQDLFTLLTINFRYPFPFDLETLAHFYRSARIFAHSAPDERRCRVAAYAWASGLPVVGMAPVGSVLSPGLRHPPYFFELADYADFPARILEALAASKVDPDFDAVKAEVASERSVIVFNEHIDRIFTERGWLPPAREGWYQGLDLRLGRHHGVSFGGNRMNQDTAALFQHLLAMDEAKISQLLDVADPEAEIVKLSPRFPRAPAKPLPVPLPLLIKQKLYPIIKPMLLLKQKLRSIIKPATR